MRVSDKGVREEGSSVENCGHTDAILAVQDELVVKIYKAWIYVLHSKLVGEWEMKENPPGPNSGFPSICKATARH